MDLLKPAAESGPSQLRALTMVARAAPNGLAEPQRAMLDAIQRVILETELDVENLEPIEESALSRDCRDATHARQLVRLMIMIAVAAGPPTSDQMKFVRSFSQALGVTEPAVQVLGNLSKNRMLLFRVGFVRRAHVRTYFRNTKKMLGGVLPLIKALLRFRGVIGEDLELAGRFRALGDLPVGTLGHVFYDHCRGAEIPLCGEQGGFPIGAMYHDFSHVLAGYDTSPEGEIKNAAFQAGFCQGDEDFFTTLFANLIHTAGVNLTPFEMPVELGRIGQGTLAMDWLLALERGSSMNVDLGDGWNFWDFVELPIEVAREKLGIPPLAA